MLVLAQSRQRRGRTMDRRYSYPPWVPLGLVKRLHRPGIRDRLSRTQLYNNGIRPNGSKLIIQLKFFLYLSVPIWAHFRLQIGFFHGGLSGQLISRHLNLEKRDQLDY